MIKTLPRYLLLTGLLLACSKEPQPAQPCQLTSMDMNSSEAGQSTVRYVYDAARRLSKTTTTNSGGVITSQTSYSYSATEAYSLQVDGPTETTIESVYKLAGNGQATAAFRLTQIRQGSLLNRILYDYDAEGYLTKATTQQLDLSLNVLSENATTYTYAQGDLTATVSSTGARTEYTYDTNRPVDYQTGIAFFGKRNAHHLRLITYTSVPALTYQNARIEYVNEFDGTGHLRQQTQKQTRRTTGDVVTITSNNYAYACP